MVARVCPLVMMVIVMLPSRPLFAQGPADQICGAAIPSNVEAGLLTGDVLALLQRSDTFRAQCGRIAAERRVRVSLEIVTVLDTGRAQTAFRRYQAGALHAEVLVQFGQNYRELLGHEFEHIIEQLDGVNLRQEAAEGRAWLLPGGAFETRRAFMTGVQVLHEGEAPHVHLAVLAATR